MFFEHKSLGYNKNLSSSLTKLKRMDRLTFNEQSNYIHMGVKKLYLLFDRKIFLFAAIFKMICKISQKNLWTDKKNVLRLERNQQHLNIDNQCCFLMHSIEKNGN